MKTIGHENSLYKSLLAYCDMSIQVKMTYVTVDEYDDEKAENFSTYIKQK